MRRLVITALTALTLTALPVAPVHAADPELVDQTLPSGWTGSDTSFVGGPDGVPSGLGSLEFSSLLDPEDVLPSDLSFDAWIWVPEHATATLAMPWTWIPQNDYLLTIPLTTTPGWNHFVLGYGTPVTWTARAFNASGVMPWGELAGCCNGPVTQLEIQVTTNDGSPPHAFIDTLSSHGASYEFEPLQQPTIGASAPVVRYGQGVTISGTVQDAAQDALPRARATLYARPTGEDSFSYVDDVLGSSSGRLASVEVPDRTTAYRWTGDTGHDSATVTVKVAPAVSVKAPAAVASGKKLAVRGAAAPAIPGLSVQLMRSGSKKPLATTPLRKDGGYTFAVKIPRGTYLVWTRTAPTTGFVAGTSKQSLVTVH